MKTAVVFVKKALGNLQVKMLLIILVFLFTPVIFSLNNFFKHTEKIIIENTSGLITDNLEQIGDKVENICLDMITLSNIILTDDTILNNLSIEQEFEFYRDKFEAKSPNLYTDDDISRITRVENQINSIKRNILFNKNAQVIIVGADGNIYSSMFNYEEDSKIKYKYTNQFLQQDWFKKLKSGERKVMWNVPYVYGIKELGDERYISIVKSIRNKYSPKDTSGVLMINFSEKNLGQIIGQPVDGYFTLISETNQILYSSDKSIEDNILANKDILSKNLYYGKGSFFTNIDHEKYMVNFFSIYRFGMCAISLMPYKDITEEINTLKYKINLLNIIVFGLFLLLGIVLLLNTIYPIQKLLKRIKKMKVGAYSVDVKENENLDDVNGLVRSFDNILNRTEELVSVVIEEQKRENDLRYEALRAQINPHFLFNTLSTIKWSAKMSGANHVAKMISSLGRLLEVSVSKGEEHIPLSEEIELLKCYIYIQNMRYNDKFELVINVADESCYSYKVLKLILQPIVENSIIHGFVDKDENCIIKIDAYLKEGHIIINVTDNGSGINDNKVEQLLNVESTERQKFSGIGLKNVHERIRMKYGGNYGLSISSEIGKGTAVSLTIPIIE